MNNKTNRNFSLRKLLLTALIAGPLATLPAPLWALPSVLAANLTTTSGVTAVAVSTTAINVTATAEKQVLTWVDFGGGASTILAADTINYFLPSASSSILNVTTGATTTTIAGTIASNGNVYVLNPNGIVLSATAVINTGGFYASTINEPLAAAGFGLNGTLSYVGPSTNGVTVNGATFQSVGTGNNVTLYGKNVDVNSATVYGNLSVNSQGGTAGTGDVTFAGASLSNPGAVTINKYVGNGGNLSVTSSGANVVLSGLGTSPTFVAGTFNAGVSAGTTVNATAVGSGYPALTNIPVTFSAPAVGGIAATGFATTSATGTIASITTSNGGTGYTVAATVTIPLPGTAFLAATAAPVAVTGGTFSSINATTAVTAINAVGFGGAAASGATGATGAYGTATSITPTITGSPGGLGQTSASASYAVTSGVITGAALAANGTAFAANGSAYTSPPNVTFANPTNLGVTVAGNLTISTANNTANTAGNVSQLVGDSIVSVAGATTITAGTTATTPVYGTIALGKVDFVSLAIPAAGATSVTDSAGGLALGNINLTSAATAALTLNVGALTAGTAITQASGTKVQLIPTATVTAPATSATGSSVTMTTTGAVTFSTLSTSTGSGSATITGDNNIILGDLGGKTYTVTTSAGTITMGNLTTTSAAATLSATGDITFGTANTSGAVSLKSSAGRVTAGNITAAGASTITAAGDISLANVAAIGGITVTSSAGSITATGGFGGSGTFTAASNISFGVSSLAATADRGTLNVPTSGTTNKVISLAPANGPINGSVTGITVATSGLGYTPNATIPITPSGNATAIATTNAIGQVTGITVIAPGTAYTTGPTITTLPTLVNSVVANGALTLTSTTGSVTFGGPIVSTSTSALSIVSAQNVALPATTAPTLSVKSTAGNITQLTAVATPVTVSGTATLDAFTDITLNNAGNNFGTVVLLNGGGGGAGIAITDINDIVIGNGTIAKGAVAITAGSGVTDPGAFTTQAALIGAIALGAPAVTNATQTGVTSGPNSLAAFKPATLAASGVVSGVTVLAAGSGYVASSAGALTLNLSSPPAANQAIAAATTLGAASPTANGFILGAGGQILGVVINSLLPLGNGYLPGSTVTLAFTDTSATGTGAAGFGNVNANGQITSVTMTNTGALYPIGTTQLQVTQAAPAAPVAETGYLNTGATGTVSSVALTGIGTQYYGAYLPTLGAVLNGNLVPNGAAAAITAYVRTAAGAITGVTVGTPGTNYASAPALTFGSGAAGVSGISGSTTVVGGAVQNTTNITSSGGVTFGTAATDSLVFNSNLTLTTASPAGTTATTSAAWSQLNTVANNIFVSGNVSLNTNGTNATLGLNPPGSVASNRFGAINASLGAGNLTVVENTTLNLGTITAANVTATSVGGDIVNSGAVTVANPGIVTVAANSIFSPGNVTLNSTTNRIDNVTIQNANNFTLVNTPATAGVAVVAGNATSGKAVAGVTSITVLGGKNATLTAAGAGDFGTVGFNLTGGGIFTITDPNSVTISNATNTGTGAVNVTAQNIVLGGGIALNSTGAANFTANGATANVVSSITDSAPNISIFGAAVFTTDGTISITKSGHSIGPVSLTTTGSVISTVKQATNITYTEAGTANLNLVRVNQSGAGADGNLVVVSTSGGIKQTAGTGLISVPTTAVTGTNTVSLTGKLGVLIDNTGATTNAITVPIALSATTDSSIVQAGPIILGNIAVTAGAFTAAASGNIANTITQATGSKIFAYGASSFTTNTAAPITLDNAGNNFGGLTLTSVGGAVSITEASTMNLVNVNTGVGALTATSSGGGIIETGSFGVVVGGLTTLTAQAAGITLNTGNTFGGVNGLLITTVGNVAIQDSAGGLTTLKSGTNVGGTLTIRNTSGTATLQDSGGNLTVTGNVLFDVGAGNINVSGAGNSFGAVQFRANTVSIAENTTVNLTAGSVASGSVSLSSNANIITSGLGTSIFSGAVNGLSLAAGGSITISNPIFVANTLTFRALGAVNLGALSLISNLNGKAPVNLGSGTPYTPPTP